MSGSRPFVIPIFLVHQGCPHKCVFCNQALITAHPPQLPTRQQFHKQVAEFLRYRGTRRNRVQIAFFGGNFLGLDKVDAKRLLGWSQQWVDRRKVDGIRFSTRPDTINSATLDILKKFSVETIELGVQSMNDKVLIASARGHSAADTRKAVSLIRQCLPDCELGIQLMIGLPQDTPQQALDSARTVVSLKPDFVRIYPTLVLADSPLATLYRQNKYVPLGLDQAVELCARIFCIFKHRDINVIRMGLQATDELQRPGAILAGPFHPSFGQLVLSKICLETILATLAGPMAGQQLQRLAAHPSMVSCVRGQHNSNLSCLESLGRIFSGTIESDTSLNPDQLTINDRHVTICYKN